VRLQRFLAQAGVSSRRKAEALIAAGAVRVNGVAVTTIGSSVEPFKDRVEVSGKRVFPETPIYRLLLKPRACLATLAPRSDRPTLARFIHTAEPGLQVVAPLDFPAEGVVLLTTDGALAEAMLKRPRVPMTYHVKLQGLVGSDETDRSSPRSSIASPSPRRIPGSRWSSPRRGPRRSRPPATSFATRSSSSPACGSAGSPSKGWRWADGAI